MTIPHHNVQTKPADVDIILLNKAITATNVDGMFKGNALTTLALVQITRNMNVSSDAFGSGKVDVHISTSEKNVGAESEGVAKISYLG